jgi:glycosyltransferase involved in cell wall biosynthesis
MYQDLRTSHIAIFTGSPITTFGGGERYVIWLANELIKSNVNVTIFSPVNNSKKNISLSAIQDMCKARIVLFRILPFHFIPIFPLFDRENFRILKKVNAIYNIDESLFTGLFLSFYSVFRKKKYIYGMHIPRSFLFGNEAAQSKFRKRIWHIYRIPLLVFFKSFVKDIHVINSNQLESLRSIGFKGNLHLIPNFVYPKVENLSFNDTEFIVLFTGTQNVEIKGIDLLVEIIRTTLQKDKGLKFFITGGFGNGSSIIDSLASRYPENIVNKGFVLEEELNQLHSKASLFIVTSRIESFSLGIVGAQSYGLPCISFKIPGPSDIILKSFQGVLIDPFEISKFSEAILKYYQLWRSNREKFKLLRKNIQRNIYNTLSVEKILPQILKMLLQ